MTCPKGYFFDLVTKKCQTESKAKCSCWKNCLNGGTCILIQNNTESCACSQGYFGSSCEFSQYRDPNSFCKFKTCLNGNIHFSK